MTLTIISQDRQTTEIKLRPLELGSNERESSHRLDEDKIHSLLARVTLTKGRQPEMVCSGSTAHKSSVGLYRMQNKAIECSALGQQSTSAGVEGRQPLQQPGLRRPGDGARSSSRRSRRGGHCSINLSRQSLGLGQSPFDGQEIRVVPMTKLIILHRSVSLLLSFFKSLQERQCQYLHMALARSLPG